MAAHAPHVHDGEPGDRRPPVVGEPQQHAAAVIRGRARLTQPRRSRRAAVWVTRLRDCTIRLASADIRSWPVAASESIESSSYSEREMPAACRSRSRATSSSRLARR